MHTFYTNRVVAYNDRLHFQARNLRQLCVNAAAKLEESRVSDMAWEEHESGESSGNEMSEADRPFKRYLPFMFFSCREAKLRFHQIAFSEFAPQIEISSNNEAINQLHLEDSATVGPGNFCLMLRTNLKIA